MGEFTSSFAVVQQKYPISKTGIIMKGLLVFLSILVVVSAGSFSDEKKKMKKWAQHKAMEACYGKDAMNQWKVKVKRAMQKCAGIPAPELDLPMFKSPVRMIQALMMGAKETQRNKMMKLVSMMTEKEEQKQVAQPAQTMAFIPYPMVQQNQKHHDGDYMMMKMMKKMMMMKMMKKMMKEDKMPLEDMDDDDDEDDDYFRGGDDDEMGMEQFFQALMKAGKGTNEALRRNKRATDADLLDIGDKLVEKLKMEQEKMKMKYGNKTCMLQELNMIDSERNLDLPRMLKEADAYNVKDKWLMDMDKKATRICYAMAESLPREVLKECMDEKMYKIKVFWHCAEMHKYKRCMGKDVKEKLEEEFGSLEKLEDDTGMDEKTLLMMTYSLLSASDM